jgi:selenocysteine-specific elongation factor
VLRRDASIRVLPAGFNARIKGLQQHGIECDEVSAGARAAIALTGVDRESLTRGDTLLTGAGWAAASILTVQLHALRDATSPIRPRQRVRVHIGTAEVLGRVALLPGELAPGGSALVQLRLESPIVARAGDHFVIRSYSPVHTIGGGVVLEPNAPKRKRLPADVLESLMKMAVPVGAEAGDNVEGATGSDVDRAMARVESAVLLAGASGLDPALLPVVTGLPPAEALAAVSASPWLTRAGERIALTDSVRTAEGAVLDRVAAFHADQPMLDGIEREAARRDLGSPPLFEAVVSSLLDGGQLVTHGNRLALPDHSPAPAADAPAAMDRLIELYRNAGLEPPDDDELPGELRDRPDLPLLIRQLESNGELIRLSISRLIRAQAVSQAAADVRSQMAEEQPLDISHFRDVLKLSRKHLIPLLEYFDRSGVTRREGAVRFLR